MKRFLLPGMALMALAVGVSAQSTPQAAGSATSGAAVQANQGQSGASAASSQTVGAQAPATDQAKGASQVSGQAGAGTEAGATASATGSGSGSDVAAGTTINAELTKGLDAKKVKEGQEVQARVTHDVRSAGRVVIPRGSKLIGHVTQAKTKTKGEASSESAIGIAFDHAVLKKGEQVPVHAVIQALAAAPVATGAYSDMGAAEGADAGMGPGAAGGGMPSSNRPGGAIGAVGQTAGGIAGNVGAQTAGTVGGVTGDVTGRTNTGVGADTSGVSGLKGITLNTAAANSAQGTLITSSGNDVKLDSGTRMLLRVTAGPQ